MVLASVFDFLRTKKQLRCIYAGNSRDHWPANLRTAGHKLGSDNVNCRRVANAANCLTTSLFPLLQKSVFISRVIDVDFLLTGGNFEQLLDPVYTIQPVIGYNRLYNWLSRVNAALEHAKRGWVWWFSCVFMEQTYHFYFPVRNDKNRRRRFLLMADRVGLLWTSILGLKKKNHTKASSYRFSSVSINHLFARIKTKIQQAGHKGWDNTDKCPRKN